MSPIRLGSALNKAAIYLGNAAINLVRLGSQLIWQNNAAPEIVLTAPNAIGALGDRNFDISVTVSTETVITFTADDPDDADTVNTYAIDGPTGFTDVPETNISTPSNTVTGLTFTIPSTLFTTVGPLSSNNVFVVTVKDNNDNSSDYTITVTEAVIAAPSVSGTHNYSANGGGSFTYTWSATNVAGVTEQYSTSNTGPWTDGTSTTAGGSVPCEGSVSATRYWRAISGSISSSVVTSTISVSDSGLTSVAPTTTWTDRSAFPSVSSWPLDSLGRDCDGDFDLAGTERTDEWRPRLNPFTGTRWMGTNSDRPSVTIDGNSWTFQSGGSVSAVYRGTYTVPDSPGSPSVPIVTSANGDGLTTANLSGQTYIPGPEVADFSIARGGTATLSLVDGSGRHPVVGVSWFNGINRINSSGGLGLTLSSSTNTQVVLGCPSGATTGDHSITLYWAGEYSYAFSGTVVQNAPTFVITVTVT